MTPAATIAKRIAGRFGIHATRTRWFGLDPWRDIARISAPVRWSTVFDVGAHWGESALRFTSMAPQATILSFEPGESNYARLVQSTRHARNINAFRVAVSDQEGEQLFYHHPHHDTRHSLQPRDDATTESVRVTTIDHVAAQLDIGRIDLLKTDTEGHDLAVLRGAEQLLRRKAIDIVYTEIGGDAADPDHTNLFSLWQYLAPFGYQFLSIYEPFVMHEPHWHLDVANALFTVR